MRDLIKAGNKINWFVNSRMELFPPMRCPLMENWISVKILDKWLISHPNVFAGAFLRNSKTIGRRQEADIAWEIQFAPLEARIQIATRLEFNWRLLNKFRDVAAFCATQEAVNNAEKQEQYPRRRILVCPGVKQRFDAMGFQRCESKLYQTAKKRPLFELNYLRVQTGIRSTPRRNK